MPSTDEFQFRCYKNNLRTIDDVIKQMEEVDRELVGTNLENLIAFNHTYLIITKHVVSLLHKKYFQKDLLMQQIDITFAKYYFTALYGFVTGKKIVPAWDMCFRFCQKDSSYQWVYMALGVNAHVNNDLAFTLSELRSSNEHDYLLVNKIIDRSLLEVVTSLQEQSFSIRNLQQRCLWMYSFILKIIIRNWRKNAWKNFRALQDRKISAKTIEGNALRTAERLTYISRF